jgi:hypothetical protein
LGPIDKLNVGRVRVATWREHDGVNDGLVKDTVGSGILVEMTSVESRGRG